jgi:hypothetical protein
MGPASVAAELLHFYREPALVRTRYLHGEIAMPDGAVVLRLALGRFTSEGMESIAEAERAPAQLAASAFVRQVCLWDRATHYQVLCLEPGAGSEEVRENYHLMMALIHPDRHEAEWPAGSAPRVNRAYATLSDPGQRALYDEQLAKAAHENTVLEGMRAARPEAVEHRPPRHRPPPARLLARFAVVGGVVVALFMVQAWWLGGSEPQHYSVLERAMPVTQRVRDVPDAPRFLGTAVTPADPLPRIEEPKRMAALGSWVPFAEKRPEPQAAPRPEVKPVERAVAAPVEPRPAASPLATAQAAPPAQPPLKLAQASPSPPPASPAPAAAPGAPSREQVEGLVALVVSYYDAGDSERLVALYDPDRLGFWSGMRTRSAYSDFFGATRERRLRIDRLTWQSGAGLALARGEAIVLAEYQDGRPRLERRVPVELDIILREAQPRIARMVLFPLGP